MSLFKKMEKESRLWGARLALAAISPALVSACDEECSGGNVCTAWVQSLEVNSYGLTIPEGDNPAWIVVKNKCPTAFWNSGLTVPKTVSDQCKAAFYQWQCGYAACPCANRNDDPNYNASKMFKFQDDIYPYAGDTCRDLNCQARRLQPSEFLPRFLKINTPSDKRELQSQDCAEGRKILSPNGTCGAIWGGNLTFHGEKEYSCAPLSQECLTAWKTWKINAGQGCDGPQSKLHLTKDFSAGVLCGAEEQATGILSLAEAVAEVAKINGAKINGTPTSPESARDLLWLVLLGASLASGCILRVAYKLRKAKPTENGESAAKKEENEVEVEGPASDAFWNPHDTENQAQPQEEAQEGKNQAQPQEEKSASEAIVEETAAKRESVLGQLLKSTFGIKTDGKAEIITKSSESVELEKVEKKKEDVYIEPHSRLETVREEEENIVDENARSLADSDADFDPDSDDSEVCGKGETQTKQEAAGDTQTE